MYITSGSNGVNLSVEFYPKLYYNINRKWERGKIHMKESIKNLLLIVAAYVGGIGVIAAAVYGLLYAALIA